MTFHPVLIASLAALALSCRAAAEEVADPAALERPRLSFGAFGTFDLVHSDERNADFSRSIVVQRGAGASRAWATDVDSLFGAQAEAQLGSRLSAVVQVVSEHNYDNTFRPHVEWANLKFNLAPQLSVRVGRTALPVFMHTESRKVAFALPWVRTPQEVYELAPVTSNDGIDAIWTSSRGRIDNTLHVAFGESSSKYRVAGGNVTKARTRDQFTVADTIDIGALSLRANYGQSRLSVPAVQPLFDAYRQFGAEGEAIARRFEARGGIVRFYGTAASYETRRWFATGEWGALRSDSHIGDREGWYVSGGARLSRFTPYLTYGEIRLNSALNDPGLDASGLPAPAAGLVLQLNRTLNTLLNAPPRQATTTAGVRFDVRRNVSLKAQFDHIDLAPGSSGTFVNLQPGFVRGSDVNLFSLSLDFVL